MIVTKDKTPDNFLIKFASDFRVPYKTVFNNLQYYVNQGNIDVELNGYDEKAETWDAEILVHFNKDMSITDIVNNIISLSYADEVSMKNDKILRLWWD